MAGKVLILGSSALKIGEAGEFDYSGSQAIKALKEEGVYTILINPNIATIQTSEHLADKVYFLPVNPHFVEKVIEKEKPDGILLSFGGQTALNCGLELHRAGVLEKNGVEVLGTPVSAIIDTEDRDRFVQRLREIGAKTARSRAASSAEEAVNIAGELGYPVIIRIAYALGGLGSGVCRSEPEVRKLAGKSLTHAAQILVEEYLEGWKEIEYEVMRDRHDNCITVCNMENFDPMGIHTGESIVAAPSQTLSNREYHLLREVAIKVIRHLGIVGECNIQYALDPRSEDYRIIEVNARLSRSSALASKATGYPLAFVAAKLALGYGLHELPNSITKVTKAFFEPALDYVVVKIPRWDLKKFRMVSRRLGSAMKSVGEVMAIGRTFEEALQKALRMLETGAQGLVGNNGEFQFENLEQELREPTEERVFAIVKALQSGYSVEDIHRLSHVDKWFLHKIARVVEIEKSLEQASSDSLPGALLQEAKQAGFSDKQIALASGKSEAEIRGLREQAGLHPFIRQIDTLGAEYPAQTNYLYLSYNGGEDDIEFGDEKSALILGSGAYRIGSSVEFDWCAVNAGYALRNSGYHTVMLNYNPETVSTDYDEFDKLFFDEITLESVLEICRKLKPAGVIVSMGGQVPNNLAMKLHRAGIKILGTSPESIDRAENRRKFSDLLDQLDIDQPPWKMLNTLEEAKVFAREVGYPALVRPSYVLSGAAMAVASNDSELAQYLQKAVRISPEHPTVISKFLDNAKEIEFDGVAQHGEIIAYAISEHVENAGVHSGDATLVLPPQRTFFETVRQMRNISRKIAAALQINGPFNIQFIARKNEVKVIECNLRASRSFPFVSKIMRVNFIDLATRAIMGEPLEKPEISLFNYDYVGVKAPHFSFTRLEGADPTLGVEMVSTGEVACLGNDFNEAFLKALIAVGYRLEVKTVLLSTGSLASKMKMLESCRLLKNLGIRFYATAGTANFLRENAIPAEILHWPLEKEQPNTVDYIKQGKIDLVINIPKNYRKEELTNGHLIRRAAVDYNVPLITNRELAMRFAEALAQVKLDDLQIKSWDEY
ncbi:MAG: carbamoyl-phosphate synthase (glutamine-hydrolyzing) large subunit [Calditrichaceae bacterium]|nr:carbamoyl-phosphate synthase (glutamine-hydrolyzing) large subunit [Calditrichia bacterium]NUQ44329.1 carbamoyl-phosphate synthase (glutamine-hydrolyzing) large subunit [Calditrichaceae bacterium]